jgi:hypothetical protein
MAHEPGNRMTATRVESLRIKAKLLQKAKRRAGKPCALKEAFAIIARHAGYPSWQQMKATIEADEVLRPPHAAAQTNVWFGTYAEGKAHLGSEVGFLLPYQRQFFVCDSDYLATLGLQPDDPDLIAVGNDWVVPADAAAWKRLVGKLRRRPARA